MSGKVYTFGSILVILAILANGCSFNNSKSPDLKSKTAETATSSKTITSSPTFTNTATKIKTPTLQTTKEIITNTPLLNSQIQVNIINSLKNNGNCRLPCWWGIDPGITSWPDANATMQVLGLTPSLDNISGAYTLLYEFSGENHALIFTMNFYLKNDFVKTIYFRSEGYNNLLSFKKVYSSLAPEQIMMEYGSPSRIDMTGGFGSGGVYYVISFYYDDLGFAISYDGKAPFIDIHSTTVPFCPTFGTKGNLTGGIGLELESNNIALNHDDLSHSLSEAGGITPQDLYNLYINSTNGVCFDTPTDLWK